MNLLLPMWNQYVGNMAVTLKINVVILLTNYYLDPRPMKICKVSPVSLNPRNAKN